MEDELVYLKVVTNYSQYILTIDEKGIYARNFLDQVSIYIPHKDVAPLLYVMSDFLKSVTTVDEMVKYEGLTSNYFMRSILKGCTLRDSYGDDFVIRSKDLKELVSAIGILTGAIKWKKS